MRRADRDRGRRRRRHLEALDLEPVGRNDADDVARHRRCGKCGRYGEHRTGPCRVGRDRLRRARPRRVDESRLLAVLVVEFPGEREVRDVDHRVAVLHRRGQRFGAVAVLEHLPVAGEDGHLVGVRDIIYLEIRLVDIAVGVLRLHHEQPDVVDGVLTDDEGLDVGPGTVGGGRGGGPRSVFKGEFAGHDVGVVGVELIRRREWAAEPFVRDARVVDTARPHEVCRHGGGVLGAPSRVRLDDELPVDLHEHGIGPRFDAVERQHRVDVRDEPGHGVGVVSLEVDVVLRIRRVDVGVLADRRHVGAEVAAAERRAPLAVGEIVHHVDAVDVDVRRDDVRCGRIVRQVARRALVLAVHLREPFRRRQKRRDRRRVVVVVQGNLSGTYDCHSYPPTQ